MINLLKYKTLILLLFWASSCAQLETTDSNKKLHEIFQSHWEWNLKSYPEWSTYEGRTEYNHLWTDRSKEAIEARKQAVRDLQAELKNFNSSKLTPENKALFEIFKNEIDESVKDQQFPSELQTLNQMYGFQSQVPRLLEIMPKKRVTDYEAIFARLNSLPENLEQQKALLREGLKLGVTPPQITLQSLTTQFKKLTITRKNENPLLIPFENLPVDWSEKDRTIIKEKLETLFNETVFPAIKKFTLFLEDEYIPNTRKSTAMSAMPNGVAWYQHMIQSHTTTDLTAEQIHQIGLDEVKRIRQEMANLAKKMNFQGPLEDFIQYLLTDKKYYFEREEDLLEAYQALCKRIDANVAKLFYTLQRTPYAVEKMPAHSAIASPAALYHGGNLKTGRAGIFYVNTSSLKSRPRWEMEALALHEAVPGHHLQISLAQEMENMPEFRKRGGYTAFVEGWGLYAEALGKEIGFFQEPSSDFGRLSFEMWRAVRLVVDTGLHALGWDRQRAIEYFVKNSGRPPSEAVIEVDRYIVRPGQALAYKIGELKIWELRRLAEKELGDKFDVRDFHDQVLKNGGVPLSLLENNIQSWIMARK